MLNMKNMDCTTILYHDLSLFDVPWCLGVGGRSGKTSVNVVIELDEVDEPWCRGLMYCLGGSRGPGPPLRFAVLDETLRVSACMRLVGRCAKDNKLCW